LKSIKAGHLGGAHGGHMQSTRSKSAIRDEASSALLRNRDETLLSVLEIDVTEMDVVELHPPYLLQLLLDPPARFQSVFETPANRLLAVFAMRAKEFKQAGNRASHGNRIAL